MSDDVGLDDGWSVADEDWYRDHSGEFEEGRQDTERSRVEFDGWPEFSLVEEITEPAILGTRAETILPADGIVLMYGDGGAGKTTLTLDASVHLADGRKWLGLEVGRPVRVLVIENEGPRAKFRQIIGEKLETLNGSDAGDRLFVLREPWSRFTLAEDGHRDDLAGYVLRNEIDVIVLGPLATVGMVGGGTPDEISAFEAKLRDVKTRIGRPVAFWIVHHENKAGDVSGAWERVPDTLIHVQSAGNGHTRLVFQKARWSSEFHGKSLALTWGDGRTFDVVEEVVRDYYADVLDSFRADDDWRTVEEIRKLVGMGTTSARSVLRELVARGDLQFEIGPSGRHPTAHCYRLRGLRLVEDDDFDL